MVVAWYCKEQPSLARDEQWLQRWGAGLGDRRPGQEPTGSLSGRDELGAAWFTDDTECCFYTGCRLPQHVPATSHMVRYWSADRMRNWISKATEDDPLGRPPRPAREASHTEENCVHTFKAPNVFRGEDSIPAFILRCKRMAARGGVWVM